MRIYLILKYKIRKLLKRWSENDEYIDWLNSEEALELEKAYEDYRC